MIVIAETGADMKAFENSSKFSGWTGLRPRMMKVPENTRALQQGGSLLMQMSGSVLVQGDNNPCESLIKSIFPDTWPSFTPSGVSVYKRRRKYSWLQEFTNQQPDTNGLFCMFPIQDLLILLRIVNRRDRIYKCW